MIFSGEVIDLNSLTREILDLVKAVNSEIPTDTSLNLLNEGYIDSFDIVNIVPVLEEHFHFDIPPEEIIPENFTSLDRMANMVQRIKDEEKE